MFFFFLPRHVTPEVFFYLEVNTLLGRDSPADTSRESSPKRPRDEKEPKDKDKKAGSKGHRSGKKGDASVKKTSSSSSQAPPAPEEDEGPQTLEEAYEVGEELGSGAFSVVKAGVHKKTGSLVAIKILDNYGNLEDGMILRGKVVRVRVRVRVYT